MLRAQGFDAPSFSAKRHAAAPQNDDTDPVPHVDTSSTSIGLGQLMKLHKQPVSGSPISESTFPQSDFVSPQKPQPVSLPEPPAYTEPTGATILTPLSDDDREALEFIKSFRSQFAPTGFSNASRTHTLPVVTRVPPPASASPRFHIAVPVNDGMSQTAASVPSDVELPPAAFSQAAVSTDLSLPPLSSVPVLASTDDNAPMEIDGGDFAPPTHRQVSLVGAAMAPTHHGSDRHKSQQQQHPHAVQPPRFSTHTSGSTTFPSIGDVRMDSVDSIHVGSFETSAAASSMMVAPVKQGSHSRSPSVSLTARSAQSTHSDSVIAAANAASSQMMEDAAEHMLLQGFADTDLS